MTIPEVDQLARILDTELVDAASSSACSSCGAVGLIGFYRIRDVPALSNVLLESRSEASRLGGAEILLALCPVCGLIQNTRFDQALVDYSLPTEESQAFSGVFAEFAGRLADDLVAGHDLVGGDVLEIGSGKGDFLALLADRGIRRGVGIDPGFLPERAPQRTNLEFRKEFYGPGHTTETAQLIIARHLLEHVPNVNEFLGWLAASTARTAGSALFLEVPETSRALGRGAFWEVYYEHCSYFTPESMRTALELVGMSVSQMETVFDDQYIHATARWSGATPSHHPDGRGVAAISREVARFARSVTGSLQAWRRRIQEIERSGGQVAIWGAASKTIAFIAATGSTNATVVDVNPFKQGKWLPGIAVQVRSPDELVEVHPELVIPMNPIYVGEITADLESMGLSPQIEAV